MSTIPTQCEHCRHDLPFGEFELTKKSTGAPKNAVWSQEFTCYVQHLRRYLCAQCGFNIVNFRVMKRYEVPEKIEKPNGKSSIRVREVFAQDRPYLRCTLITKIEPIYDVALEADRLRYHEQVAALEAQRQARRLKKYEWQLRHIGTTVRDTLQGIEPLTEDEIQEALANYTNKSIGVAAPRVRVLVTGGVTPRGQRESSTSSQGVQHTAPTLSALGAVTPRRPR